MSEEKNQSVEYREVDRLESAHSKLLSIALVQIVFPSGNTKLVSKFEQSWENVEKDGHTALIDKPNRKALHDLVDQLCDEWKDKSKEYSRGSYLPEGMRPFKGIDTSLEQ